VGNDDQLDLLGLDQGSDVVEAVLDVHGLLGGIEGLLHLLLPLLLGGLLGLLHLLGGKGLQAVSLLNLGLRAVLAHKLEELKSCKKEKGKKTRKQEKKTRG